MESSAVPQPVTNSAPKMRVLLQTVTHLVPGNCREEKLTFIKNIVCQHHWKRDYDPEQERMFPYHDDFGLENIKCYFLIDHHGYDHTIEEEKVPVVWYRWTGDSLVCVNMDLPSKIRKELKKWPFTWEGRKFHRLLPEGSDGKYDPIDERELIKSKLRLGMPLLEWDFKFLREYPEHAQWLKTHMDRRLWIKIEPFCNLSGEVDQ